MYEHGLLAPIVALAAWSLLMLIWLYATRIPAMQRAGIKPGQISNDPAAPSKLPPWARNVADNYNHLMEQPTIFYATAFALQLLNVTDQNTVMLAWAYVGLRVIHSFVQATVNIILVRKKTGKAKDTGLDSRGRFRGDDQYFQCHLPTV